jgi:hypothetical protein
MLDLDKSAFFVDCVDTILPKPNLGLRWIEGIVSFERSMQTGFHELASLRRRDSKIVDSQESGQLDSSRLKGRSAAFQTIDNRHHTKNFDSKGTDGIDGLEGTPTTRNNIFNDNALHAAGDGSLYQSPHTVLFGFFSNHKAAKRYSLLSSH